MGVCGVSVYVCECQGSNQILCGRKKEIKHILIPRVEPNLEHPK